MYDILCKIKLILNNIKEKQTKIVNPKRISIGVMRKIIKVIFHRTQFKIKLISNKDDENKIGGKSEAILINRSKDSYAETLKKLKENLREDKMFDSIIGVRKTLKGLLRSKKV